MNSDTLRRRIRGLTLFLMFGLVVSGLTAIPLETELALLAGCFTHSSQAPSALAEWIFRIRDALHQSNAQYPFLAYGTDWLAFGHVVIAIAFIGALRNPTQNIWLFTFGMIACVLIIPWALLLGAVRGIPLPWRLIDCCFGIAGMLPLWYCRKYSLELLRLEQN